MDQVWDIVPVRDERLLTPRRHHDRDYIVFGEAIVEAREQHPRYCFAIDTETDHVYELDLHDGEAPMFIDTGIALFFLILGTLEQRGHRTRYEHELYDVADDIWELLTDRDPTAAQRDQWWDIRLSRAISSY